MQLHHPEIRESLNRFTHDEVANELHTELFGKPSGDSITRRLLLKCFKELDKRYTDGSIKVPEAPTYDWPALRRDIEALILSQRKGFDSRVSSYLMCIKTEKDEAKKAQLQAEMDTFAKTFQPISWKSVWAEMQRTEAKTPALREKAEEEGDLYAAEEEAKAKVKEEAKAVRKAKAAAKRKAKLAGPKKEAPFKPTPVEETKPAPTKTPALAWAKGEEIVVMPDPPAKETEDHPEIEVVDSKVLLGISRPCTKCGESGMHKCCPKCKEETANGVDEIEELFGFRRRTKGGKIHTPQTWCRVCRKTDSAARKRDKKKTKKK